MGWVLYIRNWFWSIHARFCRQAPHQGAGSGTQRELVLPFLLWAVRPMDLKQGETPLEGVFRRFSLVANSLEPAWDWPGSSAGEGGSISETLTNFLTRLLSSEPRLYQEIQERGLHSSNQDPDDDFVHVEQPGPDEGIVVRNYRPTQLTWSQLPEVRGEEGGRKGGFNQLGEVSWRRRNAIPVCCDGNGVRITMVTRPASAVKNQITFI